MLIQITNRCQEGCRHCLQNALSDGPHMTEATFRRVIEFGRFLKNPLYVISGGEPTEHPQFFEFCKMLDRLIGKEAHFSITSNGMWYPEQKEMMEKLSRLKSYAGMQVYSNPNRFAKTITKGLMESLIEEAKKHIAEHESNPKSMVHPEVLAHWKKIAQGIPPFGYKVVDEKF